MKEEYVFKRIWKKRKKGGGRREKEEREERKEKEGGRERRLTGLSSGKKQRNIKTSKPESVLFFF